SGAPAGSTAAWPSPRNSPGGYARSGSPPTHSTATWAGSSHATPERAMKIVAFGGGHGLGASLRALRLLRTPLGLDITAVVTVGDNGGSSGRLRAERGGLPPGDLRQA